VGGQEAVQVDVRIISATNQDLREMVNSGRFREDLYYRLNVVKVELPPLRNRREDIPLLLNHFARQYTDEPLNFQRSAMRRLTAHPWPGNVREMQNEIKRLMAMGVRDVGEDDLSDEILAPSDFDVQPTDGPFQPVSLQDAERRLLLNTLDWAGWNKARAAEALGIPRTSLYHRIKKAGIKDPR